MRQAPCLGKCPPPATVLGRTIEPYVVEWWQSLVGEPEFVAREEHPSARDELLGALRAAERDVEAYRDTPGIIDTIGAESYLGGLRKRQEVADEIGDKLSELSAGQRTPDSTSLLQIFESGTIKERRELLHSVVGSVFVRNLGKRAPIHERARILRKAEMPADLPRRGHKVKLRSFAWPRDGVAPAGPPREDALSSVG